MSKHALRYVQELETCYECGYSGPAYWIGAVPLTFCSPACHAEYAGVEPHIEDYEFPSEEDL